MKKIQLTHINTVAPTASENIAAGYAIGQWWEDATTGSKYFHKTDGVWVSVESTGSGATLGLIKIVDKLGDWFANLSEAGLFIRQYTTATITDESFSNGTYWFTVPAGTTFITGPTGFLYDTYTDFYDELGLITTYGDNAFSSSGGNIEIGSATFGNNCFDSCPSGIKKLKTILLSNPSDEFAPQASGRFEIYGNIGTDETSNYPGFFAATTNAVIWAPKAKETSNAGGIEGDLATAQTNGAKLFFGYEHILTPLGLIKIVDKAGVNFTDLATAGAYVRTYTSATITNESFSNGTYWFTVPNGTDFSLTNGFLTGFFGSAYIVDELGLIDTFGADAFWANEGNNILGNCTFDGNNIFRESTGNNILGNCTFNGIRVFQGATGNNTLGNCTFTAGPFSFGVTGDNKLGDCVFGMEAFRESTGNTILGNCTFEYGGFLDAAGSATLGNCTFGSDCFYGATGIYRFGNILLSTSTFNFARFSTGRFEIYGNIGTDETAEYPNFFSDNTYQYPVIWAQKVKETSNINGIEGDLATAKTNGAKLFFGYEHILTPLGLIKIVDKSGEKFTDLATAGAYVRTFTNAAITDESFSSGNETYWFSVPNGSSFALANNFLNNSNAYIVDELGIIAEFGDSAFLSNTGNNILGNCSFGTNAFRISEGNNTLGDCTFTSYAFHQSIGNNVLGDCIFTSKALEASSGNNILGNCTFTTDAFRLATGNNILGDCTFGNTAFYNVSGNNEMGMCSFGTSAFVSSSGDNILGNCTFTDNAFQVATGNNILGNCTFGDPAFYGTTGINRFRNILLSTSTFNFASNSSGRFEIYGNIGTDETANYPNFFPSSTAVIWAHKSKETSNAGGIEGDLVTAKTNGATLFFGYEEVKYLSDALDTNIPTPLDGEVLTWNAATNKWVALPPQINSNGTNQLLTGGVSWSGTGMVFDVTALTYIIDGITYGPTTPASVTLSNGDPTYSRFDAIVVDVTGIPTVIIGTPSSNPITPTIPEDYILVQYVLISASSTTPSITNEYVYRDGSAPDWTTVTAAGAVPQLTSSFISTTPTAFQGSQCTLVTAPTYASTKYIQYTKPSGNILRSTYSFLTFRVNLPVALPTRNIYIYLYNGTTLIGAQYATNWGLNLTTINTWQLVSIPTSIFGNASITTITKVIFRFTGNALDTYSTGFDRFAIDDIKFQSGYGPQSNVASITVASNDIVTGSAPKLNFINGTDANASSTYDNLNNKIDIRIDASINVTNATKITLMYNT